MKIDKVYLKRIKRKLKNIIHIPSRRILAESLLKETIRQKREDDIIIYLTNLIGDTVYGLAYLTAIHMTYPEKRIVVVGNLKLKNLIESYQGIDKAVYIEEKKDLKKIGSFISDNHVSERAIQHWVYNSNPFYFKKCSDADNPDSLYQLKKHIYRLPEDSNIDYHHLYSETVVSAIKNFEDLKNKIIILNPYSNSAFEATDILFRKISYYLMENGYIVYTNVVGNQKPIYGTKELRCNIEELFNIARNISAIISIRSGILDYLAPSGVNMFVIYENCSEKLKKMYHLTSWKCCGKIHEIYPDNSVREAQEIVNQIGIFLEID